MNAETNAPNDTAVDDEINDPQSAPSVDFVKYAAHASWLAPIVASLMERRFSSVAVDSSMYGFFATLALVLVVTLLAVSGLGLGLYAIVRSQNIDGVRKPAVIGVILSAGFLALCLGGLVHGFNLANAVPELTNGDAADEMNRANAAPELTNSDAAREMKLFANEAVATALDDFDIKLDFSPESIEHVESILARLHDQHAQIPIDPEQMTVEALKWGGYVGEVIKTLRDCNWAVGASVSSGGFPVIVYDDYSESFPMRWCYERILYGDEHDIRHKFSNLLIDRHDAEVSSLTPTDSAP